MPLEAGAHVRISDMDFQIDESEENTYYHSAESLIPAEGRIVGQPGARQLDAEILRWAITRFDGEGQKVLDASDADTNTLFYTSEGLDFRTPGEFKLNRSIRAMTPAITGAATTTYQGNADMEDVTGTSTTSGTDRKLVAVDDKIQTNANYTPGAVNVEVEFHLYRDGFGTAATTIQGSDFNLLQGLGRVDGTDYNMDMEGTVLRSAVLTEGTEFGQNEPQRVEFYLWMEPDARPGRQSAEISIVDTYDGANAERLVAKKTIDVNGTSAPATPTGILHFDPRDDHTYRFMVRFVSRYSTHRLVLDKVRYGPEVTDNKVTIEVYNNSAGSTLKTRTLNLSATATALTGSLAFNAVAATNYRFRVKRKSGKQAIWVDKILAKNQNAAWTLDCLELGAGASGGAKVWLAGHAAAVNSRLWTYSEASDEWSDVGQLDASTSTNATVRALAHSDSREYVLLDDGTVRTMTSAGTDAVYATNIPDEEVGMTVAQERLFVMSEGTSGVTIYACPLDSAVGNITTSTDVIPDTIAAGSKSPDTTLRNRMCSTPTGARYFINYAGVTAKVYESTFDDQGHTHREIADLGTGVKATAICHEAGTTFVAGQFQAESDQTPQSALWAIAPNSVPERIGFLRFLDPSSRAPEAMVAYQQGLYVMQGKRIWRYDLMLGGLFLEYELEDASATSQRALAVYQGRVFAGFTDEVWATGTESTYRQSSMEDQGKFISSTWDFGYPATDKMLDEVRILTSDLASNTEVRVEYQTDDDGTWTLLGTSDSGTVHSFRASVDGNPIIFNALQLRVSPETMDGVSSPEVRGIVADAYLAKGSEFFDLVLRAPDEDSSDRVGLEQLPGRERVRKLFRLWRSHAPTTLTDDYVDHEAQYLVRLERVEALGLKQGEARARVRMRVL